MCYRQKPNFFHAIEPRRTSIDKATLHKYKVSIFSSWTLQPLTVGARFFDEILIRAV